MNCYKLSFRADEEEQNMSAEAGIEISCVRVRCDESESYCGA